MVDTGEMLLLPSLSSLLAFIIHLHHNFLGDAPHFLNTSNRLGNV